MEHYEFLNPDGREEPVIFTIMEHPFLFSNDFDSWHVFRTSCGQ